MYKHILTILLILIPIIFKAQKKAHELGIFVGVGYYMGDINQYKVFYSPQPTLAFLYKFDLNPRYAIRFNTSFARLSGDDADFENGYQQQRNHRFDILVTEFAGLVEFNFLPYKPESRFEYFSPYITFGIGVTLMPSEEDDIPIKPVIPFGVGIKYAMTKKLCIAAEWTYRKTFTDYIDQLPEQNYTESATFENKQRNYNSSKDWYSFAGITLTYKFAFGNSKCPAYKN